MCLSSEQSRNNAGKENAADNSLKSLPHTVYFSCREENVIEFPAGSRSAENKRTQKKILCDVKTQEEHDMLFLSQ